MILKRGTDPYPSIMEAVVKMILFTQVAEAFSQTDSIPLELTTRHQSNQCSLREGQTADWFISLPVAIAPSQDIAFSQNNNRKLKHIPVTALKAPFLIPVIQEFFNLVRDDVLRLRRAPPLLRFRLTAWFIYEYVLGLCIICSASNS